MLAYVPHGTFQFQTAFPTHGNRRVSLWPDRRFSFRNHRYAPALGFFRCHCVISLLDIFGDPIRDFSESAPLVVGGTTIVHAHQLTSLIAGQAKFL